MKKFKFQTNFQFISVFGYENKEKHPIYISKKNVMEKNTLIYY